MNEPTSPPNPPTPHSNHQASQTNLQYVVELILGWARTHPKSVFGVLVILMLLAGVIFFIYIFKEPIGARIFEKDVPSIVAKKDTQKTVIIPPKEVMKPVAKDTQNKVIDKPKKAVEPTNIDTIPVTKEINPKITVPPKTQKEKPVPKKTTVIVKPKPPIIPSEPSTSPMAIASVKVWNDYQSILAQAENEMALDSKDAQTKLKHNLKLLADLQKIDASQANDDLKHHIKEHIELGGMYIIWVSDGEMLRNSSYNKERQKKYNEEEKILKRRKPVLLEQESTVSEKLETNYTRKFTISHRYWGFL